MIRILNLLLLTFLLIICISGVIVGLRIKDKAFVICAMILSIFFTIMIVVTLVSLL